MPDSLNPRQRQILDYLRDHSRDHSYPPTVREIGRAVGLSSSSTVQNHLNTLETRGFITRDPAKSRTVEIVNADVSRGHGGNIVHLPLVGRVAAGTPVLAVENVEEHLDVGTEIAGGADSYALTVHGVTLPGVPALIVSGATTSRPPREVVKAHKDRLVDQIAHVLDDGLKQGVFQVADTKATARALFDATSRFHHPAHADEWRDPDHAARVDAVLALLLRGLEAPRKR